MTHDPQTKCENLSQACLPQYPLRGANVPTRFFLESAKQFASIPARLAHSRLPATEINPGLAHPATLRKAVDHLDEGHQNADLRRVLVLGQAQAFHDGLPNKVDFSPQIILRT